MKVKSTTKPFTGLVKAQGIRQALAASKAPDWMITDRTSQRQALDMQRSMSGANRPPELWVKEGEEKEVRFRDPGPLMMLWTYRLRFQGRWCAFTRPGNNQVDLFAAQGLRPSLRAIYELIDIKGYQDKQTSKWKRNVPRFANCNSRLHEQLELIARRCGPLNKFNIVLSRAGSGPQTMYQAVSLPISPMKPEWAAIPRLSAECAKYYAPPDEDKQRAILSTATFDDASRGPAAPFHNEEVEEEVEE